MTQVAGGALVLHSADNFIAMLRSPAGGTPARPLTTQGLSLAGGLFLDEPNARAFGTIGNMLVPIAISTGAVYVYLFRGGAIGSVQAPKMGIDWIRRPEGTRLRKLGNYWIKEVDPDAWAIQRWWGGGSLNAQARALDRLGDMAPSHLFKNGKLMMRDVGKFEGTTSEFLRIWAKGSCRLRTPFNDIRPRNIGANGQIFDPALHPIQQVIYIGGSAFVIYKTGELVYYSLED